jgi:acetyl-CoA carboxylase alpha subunit
MDTFYYDYFIKDSALSYKPEIQLEDEVTLNPDVSDENEKAAEELKLTSDHMLGFGLVDGVIPEPIGGAHWDHDEAAAMLKKQITIAIDELKDIDPETRIDQRIDKFSKMGRWEEQPNQVS